MKTTAKVVVGVGAGLAVMATLAAPVVAVASSPGEAAGFGVAARGGNPGAAAGSGTGRHAGRGAGWGAGRGARADGCEGVTGRGRGAGERGSGSNLAGVPSGSLTDAQRGAVAAMAEEEKLAHDVYVALGTKYPDLVQFQRIPRSETNHLALLRTVMTRYSITDPTAGKAAGEFTTKAVQDQYDKLVAQGSAGADAALQVGVNVEEMDIADLRKAGAGVTAPDVVAAYSRLTTGSQHHLAAFKR